MKKIIVLLSLFASQSGMAQKFISTDGTIRFFSEELLEDITAVNKKAKSVFDSKTGQIVFSIPIIAFDFEKTLMQEHFNEKYLESEKYPNATFKGKITGYKINRKNPEVYAEGELEIHGVSRHVVVPGSLNFTDDKLYVNTVFNVKLSDYNIKVPELMFQKIAEIVEVTINMEYEIYNR